MFGKPQALTCAPVTWLPLFRISFIETEQRKTIYLFYPRGIKVHPSSKVVRREDIVIPAICCVDQILLYGDLYVGHPPPTQPSYSQTQTKRGKIGTRLMPSKSLSADPLGSFASLPSWVTFKDLRKAMRGRRNTRRSPCETP